MISSVTYFIREVNISFLLSISELTATVIPCIVLLEITLPNVTPVVIIGGWDMLDNKSVRIG